MLYRLILPAGRKLPRVVACSLLLVCLASCADLFLPINPPGAEGEVCTGRFLTADPTELCRRQADGALGAFDVFMRDLVVTADGDVLLAGKIVVGSAEISQVFDSGDPLAEVFWHLKDSDDTLLRLDELDANPDVALALLTGDPDVIRALDFIEDFARFYILNFNILLAQENGITYGIDDFFGCVSEPPSDRGTICATLYDLDRNGTLDSDDYVALVAVVESEEAAEQVDPSPVFSASTLSTFYFCADQQFSDDNPITPQCALIDLDRNRAVDEIDLRLLFNSSSLPDQGNNSRPVAIAGAAQTATSDETVTLDGSASVDLETATDDLLFQWEQVSGARVDLTGAGTDRPEFNAPSVDENAELEFRLTVTDGGGLSDSDTVIITVQPVGPVADAGANQQVDAGELVILDGSGSDGTDITFAWTQIGASTVTLSSNTTEQPVFTAPTVSAPTVLTFQLVVSDANGLQNSDTVDITILAGTSGGSLQANAGADQQVTEGDLVTLDGTASQGSGLTFSWSQTSGTTASLSSTSTAQPVFVAPTVTTPTALRFRLTVTDDNGDSDTDDVDITVLNGP